MESPVPHFRQLYEKSKSTRELELSIRDSVQSFDLEPYFIREEPQSCSKMVLGLVFCTMGITVVVLGAKKALEHRSEILSFWVGGFALLALGVFYTYSYVRNRYIN